MHDINCPYCDAELEINHDDWAWYEEGRAHEMQCHKCDKYFIFYTSISFDYDPQQADCLNTGDHIMQPSRSYPKQFSNMVCATCDYHRACTDEEMQSILNSN